ncbi:MAG: C39 family peptidase, partial [Candidatus Eremiobacteraeota bacterium]|nr:C39 family peptidase [Candidatus Eremiobacteraeota bacterium]
MACEPTREAVLSWNTRAPSGDLSFRLLRDQKPATTRLMHSGWRPGMRRSFSPQESGVRVETDIIKAEHPFDGVEVCAPGVYFEALGLAIPPRSSPRTEHFGGAIELAVPTRSQYVVEGERGWCSPASLSMIHAYFGHPMGVAEVAGEVFDSAYNGTGNWSFNVAFSGRLGLRGFVAYLRDLTHAATFIAARIPLALSYSWNADELPGAPIEHSDGHLAVLAGFTDAGDPIVNDPACSQLRAIYP